MIMLGAFVFFLIMWGSVAAVTLFGLGALGVFTFVGQVGGGLIGICLGALAIVATFITFMWWEAK